MRAFAALLLMVGTAHAECEPHAQMLANLALNYQEVPAKRKLAYANELFIGVLEWTENTDTDTWTLLLTFNGGRTCILFSGDKKGFPS